LIRSSTIHEDGPARTGVSEEGVGRVAGGDDPEACSLSYVVRGEGVWRGWVFKDSLEFRTGF